MTEPRINPYLAVLLAVGGVACASIFVRLAAGPPLAVAFYRLAFTTLLLAPLALTGQRRTELKGAGRRDLGLAALAGVFIALHFATWIASLELTSIASSTVLVTMQPLFVITLGALVLGERIRVRAALAAAATLIGSVIVGAGDFEVGGQAFWGDLLAFSGAFFVAVYILIGRQVRARLSLFPYVFLVFGSGALFLLLVNLLAGVTMYPLPLATWLWTLALAVFSTILGHTVYNWALGYVKAAVVSVANLGEPLVATTLGFLLFAEAPGLAQVLGGLLIIAGLYCFLTTVNK